MTVVGDRFAQREENNMPMEDKGAVAPFVTQPYPSKQRGEVASDPAFKVLVIDQTTDDRASMRIAREAAGFVTAAAHMIVYLLILKSPRIQKKPNLPAEPCNKLCFSQLVNVWQVERHQRCL